MHGLLARLRVVSPVQLAFFGSLLLSLVAVMGEVTIGKDGAFYVDIAATFLESGLAAAFDRFNWPWFSVLLGSLHGLTGIPTEALAYLLCALFMAGTCALLVDITLQRAPQAGYWACLVVLAMPAFNSFRGDVLREFGFWFFSVLALWQAMRWAQRPSWTGGVLIQLAIGLAALFRMEAVLLMPALAVWQLSLLRSFAGLRTFIQLNLLPLLLVVAGVIGLLVANVSLGRLADYAEMLDPRQIQKGFEAKADLLGETVMHRFSANDGGEVLFFGLLGSVLLKFLKLFGPFLVPFFFSQGRAAVKQYVQDYKPFVWTLLFYFVVIMLFYIQQLFMNARYLSFLNMLAVPAAVIAFAWFAQQFPRWSKALAFVALLVMLDNVISLSAKKTHYVDSGRWIGANLDPAASIYYEDSRIAYHAGRGYPKRGVAPRMAMSEAYRERYDYFVIEADGDEQWLLEWLQQHDLRVIEKFANRKKDTVLVIGN
ncbi:hypothetical protein GJV18_04840 [Pseudomonas sp. R-22-3w-18]|uniref:Uncharacterized protein n=2 Tax=Pseudomonas xionganensis TaxID=2654845 RepID=A0A6I4KRC3_9PSED|nr:hypothetical protein [Pseudomonas xionganensis]